MNKPDSNEPVANHCVYVCIGISCSNKGGQEVLKKFEEILKTTCGNSSPDGHFQLDKLTCMGACRNGPNVTIDEKYFGQLTPSKVDGVLEKFLSNKNPLLHLEANCPYCQKHLSEPVFPSRRKQIQLQSHRRGLDYPIWIHVYQKGAEFLTPLAFEGGEKIPFSCPHCKMSLIDGAQLCDQCQNDVVSLDLEDGQSLWFCRNKECGNYGIE